jgi:hypothetical protein
MGVQFPEGVWQKHGNLCLMRCARRADELPLFGSCLRLLFIPSSLLLLYLADFPEILIGTSKTESGYEEGFVRGAKFYLIRTPNRVFSKG